MSATPKIVPANKVGFDQNVLKANMDALKLRYPELYEQVKRTRITDRYGVSLYKNRWPNLHVRKGKEYSPLYGSGHPEEFAIKSFQEQFKPHSKNLVFLGIGLSYHANGFFQSEEKAETFSTIFVEKDIELFKISLGISNIAFLFRNQNAHFFVGLRQDESYSKLWRYFMEKQWIVLHARSTCVILNDALYEHEKDYYSAVAKNLIHALYQSFIFFGNDPYDSLLGIEHMFLNLKSIIQLPGVNLFFNKFKNMPAVVASTGPSLKKQLPLLKEIQGKVLILAPEASLRALTDAGIRPNFVTSLERVPGVEKLVSPFDFGDDMHYVPVPVVVPEVFDACNGSMFIGYRGFHHFRWLGVDRGILWIKGSAGNMCYNLATAFGCNPIIVIGQDHAYGEDYRTHAEGTIHIAEQKVDKANLVKLPGYYGGEVDSTWVWQMFRNHYITDVAEGNTKGIITINATEGGASIDGAVHIPFADAISTYVAKRQPERINDKILRLRDKFSVDVDREKQRIHAKLTRAIGLAEKNIHELLEGLDYTRKVIEKYADYVYERVQVEDLDAAEIRKDYYDLEQLRIKARYTKNEDYVALVLHVLQPYLINYESQYSNMPAAYDNPAEGQLTAVLTCEDYFLNAIHLANIARRTLQETKDAMERPTAVVLPPESAEKPDASLLWRQHFDNELCLWRFSAHAEVRALTPAYRIGGSLYEEGAGTFDGYTGILLRNRNIFAQELHLLLTNHPEHDKPCKLAGLGREWQIEVVRLRPASDDILIRSHKDNAVLLWILEAGKLSRIVQLGEVAPELELLGTGDVDGDGVEEILWRCTRSHELSAWKIAPGYLESARLAEESLGGGDVMGYVLDRAEGVFSEMVLAELPARSQVIAIADVRGTGRDELVVRDSETGEVQLIAVGSDARVSTGVLGDDLRVEGSGAFLGNGRKQLLVGQCYGGDVFLWDWQAEGFVSQPLGTRPGFWMPQSSVAAE
ncbi:protein of unknown function DUF115 [Desulfurispirillum indicum S5]|uniref:6-hydroxymethylpterin diphosphokinase MptE-like domain-containing protein n=1 Tax=Desulfurispirillum indicum (strain ATCC BAA-1389 / DSM 22839 / S5) TaxID=653733 RepID=E6W2M4_DESIS|nr:6-hydroxymethylpterin diphosphokinase MptE-like protein [Desulfurispirillum indicum]ADU65608.1 protein of unknown function DUF115 [Desulfurispirillum indicum S5]